MWEDVPSGPSQWLHGAVVGVYLVKQMGRGRDPGEISRKAEEHQKSAREIHELSQNFIRVANSKFPRYNAFLGNVRERVTLTFHEIDQLARIAEGKAPLPMAR